MFIEYLDRHYKCPASTRNIVAHMRQFLTLAGASTEEVYHPRVKRALDALDRTSTYIPQPRLPVPLKIFKEAILAIPDTMEGSLIRAAVLTLFHGAMRRTELCPPSVSTFDPRIHLTRADVTLHKDGVTIKIRHAKNAQRYDQSQTRQLAKSPEAMLCPWAALAAAVVLVPTHHPKEPMLMFPDRNPVTAPYVAEHWGKALLKIKAPTGFHRLHSLRKAAADTAFQKGATIEQVQNFGGWRSDAVWAYVQKKASKQISKTIVNAITKL